MGALLKEILKILPESSCILHGWHQLPEHLSSDLDIIVSQEDLPKLEAHLLDLSDARLVNLLQHESTCYYFVLASQEKGRFRFLQVDAAVDYRRNGRIWFSADELLRRRKPWKDFWVASPEVEFKYLLVKKILKGVVPEHSASRLKELVEELGTQSRDLLTVLLGSHDGERVLHWIQTGDWETFRRHIPELQKILKRQKTRQDPLNSLRYWLAEVKRIWERWRHPTGLFVVVLGPDGAGKSTLINHLEADMSGAFRRTARFHLMPGLFRKTGNSGPVTNPHGKPYRSFFTSLLKLVYYLLDYNLGYWLKVRPALARSTLVLFDRYYHDVLVDPKRYRYGGPKWLSWWLTRFIPHPDLWLILDVSEEEILRRKQEVPSEELHRQREAYRCLATDLLNAVILDGSLSPEELSIHAEELILEYLHDRYISRRSLWFSQRKTEIEYLNKSLHAHPSRSGKPFLRVALPDGRGYLLPFNPSNAAVKGLFLYSPQKKRTKLLKDILSTLLQLGIAQHLVPKVNLDIIGFERFLEEVFGERNLSFAISLGTPGPHRKPVVQVMDQNSQILGYVKVGWNRETQILVRNEALILKYLQEKAPSFLVPRILFAGEWRGQFVCVQSSPSLHQVKPAPQKWGSLYEQALREMLLLGTERKRILESEFWKHMQIHVSQIRSNYWQHTLTRFMEHILDRHGNKELSFHLSHGDFAPWNALIINNHFYLYDWEYALMSAPAGYDLFHFAVQRALLLEDRGPSEILNAVKEIFNQTQSYRQAIEMDASDWVIAFELYLINQLLFGKKRIQNIKILKFLSLFENLPEVIL